MPNPLGDGLLEHCCAYLDWLDDLRRRHPEVMIENCGSGAMRADYAQLSRLDLQSTSDQCDPLIYAAIAAGAGMTILPEQQGNWGYAQQEMDDETAVFTLATGVLGRLYLSGFIDRMTEPASFARSRCRRLTSLRACRPAAYGAVLAVGTSRFRWRLARRRVAPCRSGCARPVRARRRRLE